MSRLLALATCTAVTAIAAPAPARADDYRRSDVLKWAGAGFAAVHLADHVIRNNHNGWPFSDRVTPATAAYLGIPTIFGVGLEFDGPLYWVIADSVLLGAVLLTHTVVEPPEQVYRPWTNGSNLLEVESPAVGVGAVVVVIATTGLVGAHLVSTILDGRAHGFTWRRRSEPRRERDPGFAIVPTRGGGLVTTAWSF